MYIVTIITQQIHSSGAIVMATLNQKQTQESIEHAKGRLIE